MADKFSMEPHLSFKNHCCHFCNKLSSPQYITEPMILDSPPSSPACFCYASNFLPPFLMGESQYSTPTTNIRPNMNIPNLKFTIPKDAKNLRQKLFNQSLNDSNLTQPLYVNVCTKKIGPPKQGLFDTLGNRAVQAMVNNTTQRCNKYFNTTCNECSRAANKCRCIYIANGQKFTRSEMGNISWVTVFGFPPGATSFVLAQLTTCGSIVEKKFAKHGNWIHLKYSSPYEASKALKLNGKLLCGNIMIGIVPYYNKEDTKKTAGITSPVRARSLKHSLVPPQTSNTVIVRKVPQKSTGIITKAIEYMFGW